MKKFLLSFVFLFCFSSNGFAVETCMKAAFHDPSMAAPNNLVVVSSVDWEQLNFLEGTLKVVLLRVFYENPLGHPVATGFSGDQQYGLSFVPASSASGFRKRIHISSYNDVGAGGPEAGKRSTYRESLNATDPVTVERQEAPPLDDEIFMRSNDVNLIGEDFNIEGYDQLLLDANNHPGMAPGAGNC